MKLLTQPEDGVDAVLHELEKAKQSIEIAIFRCDHPQIERALIDAVKRGVAVKALIASTNRGGEKRLRGLEMRLLACGVVVARTNNDLPRYHGKYFIIDGKKMALLAFNFTRADLQGTRSFGVVTTNAKSVREAQKLFLADSTRQPYESGSNALLVSPVNARERLAKFLDGAKKELLIYDLDVSDTDMIRILRERAAAGVEIRIIGHMKDPGEGIEVRAPWNLRLHARTTVRDRTEFVLGSQSLRRLELDMRREVGLLVDHPNLAARVAKTFDEDWEAAREGVVPIDKVAKKVAKAVVKDLGPVSAILEETAAKIGTELGPGCTDIDDIVKEAVKTAVREAVQEVVSNGN